MKTKVRVNRLQNFRWIDKMSLTKDRQGYLGDLNDLTVPQLKDLLERQEKILAKKKFVNSLQDKGEKIQAFAVKLKQLISERSSNPNSNSVDFSLQRSQRLHDGTCVPHATDESYAVMNDKNEATFEALVTRDEINVAYSSESNEIENKFVNPDVEIGSQAELTLRMKDLSVGTDLSQGTANHPDNSYERVIRKAETDPSTVHSKFLPHKSKKDNSSVVFGAASVKSNPNNVQEESAVHPPAYQYESTKLISIEESVQLIQDQKNRTEILASERAAQRLASQLSTKMDTYQPSDIDMRYRQTKGNVSDDEQDSDDFPSDNDDVDDKL